MLQHDDKVRQLAFKALSYLGAAVATDEILKALAETLLIEVSKIKIVPGGTSSAIWDTPSGYSLMALKVIGAVEATDEIRKSLGIMLNSININIRQSAEAAVRTIITSELNNGISNSSNLCLIFTNSAKQFDFLISEIHNNWRLFYHPADTKRKEQTIALQVNQLSKGQTPIWD